EIGSVHLTLIQKADEVKKKREAGERECDEDGGIETEKITSHPANPFLSQFPGRVRAGFPFFPGPDIYGFLIRALCAMEMGRCDKRARF
ncbi:hypothetical protein GWI33_012383, partial [Rhynchophorus ferrugineus]